MTVKDLPEKTRLIQLAEESAELAQASLKLVRVLEGQTPVTENDARAHLVEEIADVMVCIASLTVDLTDINTIAMYKTQRWTDRLREV